jgi:hypothetical protein
VKGEAIYIPPPPCVPIDTCGAGDASASGILYSVLRGTSDLKASACWLHRSLRSKAHAYGFRMRTDWLNRLPFTWTAWSSVQMFEHMSFKRLISYAVVQMLGIYLYIRSLSLVVVGLVHCLGLSTECGSCLWSPCTNCVNVILFCMWSSTGQSAEIAVQSDFVGWDSIWLGETLLSHTKR